MKSLYYISTQPATLYYAWQVEVMVNNFLKNGILPEYIHVVSSINGEHIPLEWNKLRLHFPSITFSFYEDNRVNKFYPVSVRPHILKKHFEQHPYLSNHAIMYHDCDMIFTKPVNWDKYLNDDIWYGSDTTSYIGAKYIKSKECGIYSRMCEIVGIDESVPEKNEINSSGAQIIMKNVTVEYWNKVENDCDELYQFFINHLKQFPKTDTYHPIQMWTAEMWAILWNAWYFNHKTYVEKEMDFAWPGHPLKSWEEKYIYHNAGVVGKSETERLFYKGMYINKIPYDDIDLAWIKSDRCSYKYAEEIVETSRKTCII